MSDIIYNLLQTILSNLHQIGVLALSTLGIALTYKTANATNFSQAITATIGAYMAAFLVRDAGCNPFLAMLCGILLCLILGALGIANMWAAIFADVGVMIIAVLNAIRALNVKKL